MSKVKDIVKTVITPFWSAPEAPRMEVKDDQPVMPDADEATLTKNREAAIQRQRKRSGRASTILSSSGKLGG